jgi:hypothetical protein
MLDLYPKIVPILHHTVQEEENTLETVLSIVEGYAARLTHTSSYATSCALTANRFTRYVLVGGQEFLKTHAKQVLGVVEVMLNQSSMAAEQHILSCQIIDILLQLYPQVLCTSCVRCGACAVTPFVRSRRYVCSTNVSSLAIVQDFAPMLENIFERVLFLSFAYPETEAQKMDLVRACARSCYAARKACC